MASTSNAELRAILVSTIFLSPFLGNVTSISLFDNFELSVFDKVKRYVTSVFGAKFCNDVVYPSRWSFLSVTSTCNRVADVLLTGIS